MYKSFKIFDGSIFAAKRLQLFYKYSVFKSYVTSKGT